MSRIRVLALALVTTAETVVTASPPAAAAGATLTVNVAQPFRPVTHVASGGLYGEPENSPARRLPTQLRVGLTSLHPNLAVRGDASGGR
ncbi:hypothetical protein ACQEVF_41490 [Nonomuraea polychroma]|uniref:hypothetical protein n=1 Tax=Nonomuraea polychroma TaxID=46176 RepID=UPI003D89E0EE